jgi:hypothetical protein
MATEFTYSDWVAAKEDLAWSKERFDKINSELAMDMLERGTKSELDTVYGVDYQFTVVQSETVKFDETTLLKALGKRAYSKVADLKLNKKKLEEAIKNGTVDADLVSRNAVISRNSPYIRHSAYTGED